MFPTAWRVVTEPNHETVSKVRTDTFTHVTLGIVHWHIYAVADLVSGAYQIIGTPDGGSDSNYTDSDEFPTWTITLQNIQP